MCIIRKISSAAVIFNLFFLFSLSVRAEIGCQFDSIQKKKVTALFSCPKFRSIRLQSSEASVSDVLGFTNHLEQIAKDLKMDLGVFSNLERVELVENTIYKFEIGLFSTEDQSIDELEQAITTFRSELPDSVVMGALDVRQPMVFLFLDSILWDRDFRTGRDVLQHLIPHVGQGLPEAYTHYVKLFDLLNGASSFSNWKNIIEQSLPDNHVVDWNVINSEYRKGASLQTSAYVGWGSAWLNKSTYSQALTHMFKE